MQRTEFVRQRPLTKLLLTAFAIALFSGCQSHGLAPVSPGDPYAENAPKTQEEKDYYNDVYSGEWKKGSPELGYFGLSKMFVSTTPPPHWNMEPPAGSKSMAQIYQENYDRQMQAAQGQRATNSMPNYANVPYNGQNAAPSYQPDNANPRVSYNPNSLDGKSYPSSGNDFIGPKEGADEGLPESKGSPFSRLLHGWTYHKPSLPTLPTGTTAAIEQTVMRGQNADNNLGNPVEEPVTIDPSLEQQWRQINREGLREESRKAETRGDEYILSGGDEGSEAYINTQGEVSHLEAEDTITGFRTPDGRILIEPTNRISIYSPRFGSVRRIEGASSETLGTALNQTVNQVGYQVQGAAAGIDIRSQEEQTSLARNKVKTSGTAGHQPSTTLETEEGVMEDLGLTKLGDLAQKLMTADSTVLASLRSAEATSYPAAWGEIQEVSVEIENATTEGLVLLQGAESLYTVETDTKSSKLRVLKTASKKAAAPGELIEFAIRYENIGETPINSITILDSLAARLDYVPESAKTSRNATFTRKVNEAGGESLRWEIKEPLAPQQYGVISFMCKVL